MLAAVRGCFAARHSISWNRAAIRAVSGCHLHQTQRFAMLGTSCGSPAARHPIACHHVTFRAAFGCDIDQTQRLAMDATVCGRTANLTKTGLFGACGIRAALGSHVDQTQRLAMDATVCGRTANLTKIGLYGACGLRAASRHHVDQTQRLAMDATVRGYTATLTKTSMFGTCGIRAHSLSRLAFAFGRLCRRGYGRTHSNNFTRVVITRGLASLAKVSHIHRFVPRVGCVRWGCTWCIAFSSALPITSCSIACVLTLDARHVRLYFVARQPDPLSIDRDAALGQVPE